MPCEEREKLGTWAALDLFLLSFRLKALIRIGNSCLRAAPETATADSLSPNTQVQGKRRQESNHWSLFSFSAFLLRKQKLFHFCYFICPSRQLPEGNEDKVTTLCSLKWLRSRASGQGWAGGKPQLPAAPLLAAPSGLSLVAVDRQDTGPEGGAADGRRRD